MNAKPVRGTNAKQIKGTIPMQIYNVGQGLINNKEYKDWSDILTNALRYWMENRGLFTRTPVVVEEEVEPEPERKKRKGRW